MLKQIWIIAVCFAVGYAGCIQAADKAPEPEPTKAELGHKLNYLREHQAHINTQRSLMQLDERFTNQEIQLVLEAIAELNKKEKEKEAKAAADAKDSSGPDTGTRQKRSTGK